MLQVGITANVQLVKAEINDKESLVLTLKVKEDEATELKEKSIDELMDDAAGNSGAGESTFIMWPFVANEQDGTPRDIKNISSDITGLKAQLEHILQGYMSKTEATINAYEGVEITASNMDVMLHREDVLGKIYKNITREFLSKVDQIKDKMETELFRVLLIRRSSNSHYPAFRKKFLTTSPFWENMRIPEKASKLAFTKWEITNGLNSGAPVAAPDEEKENANIESQINDVLGMR